ncbi:MAG: M3 family oligoendopeptidase, partial [Cetobacterium sp.]
TNRNQEDRKKAFEALYNSFNINKNTYASIYKSILQRDFADAQSRNYTSSLQKSLNPKNIPLDVYKTLIESTRENTAPLKRYISLRKKALEINDYHYYDNSINLIDYKKDFSYEEAKKTVLESVKPLGEDYYKGLSTALSDGWLDVYEAPNKRSGAYSLNIYDVHPYMLLNYNGTMDAVFTLAHELGHTMHSMLSTKNQPYPISSYTIFVAEVASTFNERLLLDNMLKNTTDSKEKIALIEQAIGGIVGTFYIQTLFADYEYEAHKIVENGGAITPEVLNKIMENLFKDYFGSDLAMDELQKIIWARIPHFFNSPYYVYQYATSFASSANLYDRVT